LIRVFGLADSSIAVLYHQIEKVKKPEDLAERQQNLEKLKKEHGIE
jgi:pre-mRNA branch site protein p14